MERLIAGFLLIVMALAMDINVDDSKIYSVTLYPNQALIKRRFRLPQILENGYHTIHVGGLLRNLDTNSLRIHGSGYLELLDISMMDNENPTQVAFKKTAEKKILELENEIAALQSNRTRLDTKLQHLKDFLANSVAAIVSTNGRSLSVQDMTGIMNYYEKEHSEASSDLLAIASRLKSSIAELDVWKGNLRNVQNAFHTKDYMNHKQLAIRVHAQPPADSRSLETTEMDFQLSYQTSRQFAVQWNPVYDINLSEITHDEKCVDFACYEHSLAVDYYASIVQSTGENWSNVTLSLNTVNVEELGGVSEPTRRGVYFAEEQMYGGGDVRMHRVVSKRGHGHAMSFAAAPMMEDAGMTTMATPAAVPEMMMTAAVGVAHGDLSAAYTFHLPHPVDIPTREVSGRKSMQEWLDNAPGTSSQLESQRVFIRKESVPTTVFSYVVPSHNDKAYLRAYCTEYGSSKDTAPLLSSEYGRVFVDGAYLGTTAVPSAAPGGEVSFHFGVDKKIEVKSTAVLPQNAGTEEDRSTWFVSDKKKYRVQTEERLITAKNLHDKPHLLIMSENVPKSTHADIKVELVSPAHPVEIAGDLASSDEDCVKVLIQKLHGQKTLSGPLHFHCVASHNVFWVYWLKPQERINAVFKYRTTWPDERQISIH